MIVRVAKSRKMPTLNSYYLKSFGQAALEMLKASKPFAVYWKDLTEYECTKDVFEKVALNEQVVDISYDYSLSFSKFERKTKAKYGYQEDAVTFAMTTNNIFVNFPQGMGKSLTAMKIIDARKFRRTLIICGQGNLQEEWIKDVKKHGYDKKFTFSIVGDDAGASSSKKITYFENHKKDVNRVDLINIEALRNTDIVFEINDTKYDCIIVDEVQSAKGWKAEQTKGLHEIIRIEGQARIALSGTPVLNNPLEFFSMVKYFGLLQDTAKSTFENYYGVWGFDRWGHYVCTGYRHLKDLSDLISPVLCYADKSELGLPPKHRKKIDIDWAPSERFSYLEKVSKMPIKRLKASGFKSKPEVRAEMQFISSTVPGKMEFVRNQAATSKVLVFSQYTTVLEEYLANLKQNGCKVLYYHGALSMKQRLEVLDRWHKGEADILLLSEMTARYGLNLTEATVDIFLEPPTSFHTLEQLEDRSHRIGQTKEVNSYLLSATYFDEEDLENIERKQEALDKLNSMLQADFVHNIEGGESI